MYLVSPDYLNTVTSKNSINTPPHPPAKVRKAPEAEKKHTTSSKGRRSAKKMKSKKRKYSSHEHDTWVAKRSAARRDYDKFVKVSAKLHEADVQKRDR
jgi:biopolymer transport protein ExbD